VAERGIDLRRHHEVVAVDFDGGTVTVAGPEGRFDQPYGDLLVATGATPIASPICGVDLEGAFRMHHMDSAAAMRPYLEPAGVDAGIDVPSVDAALVERLAAQEPPETAAIVGGGYVGVEMAEALSAHDCEVHLFQARARPLEPFGEAAGDRVAETIREEGIESHLGVEVNSLVSGDRLAAVRWAGEEIADDLAVVGIGVAPATDLLAGSGVELGASGAVATDEYGQTNRDGVYAAGDCAETIHAVTGEPVWIPLGLTANRAGRAIGQTVAGDPTPVGEIVGTAVVKAFDLEVCRAGIIDEEHAVAAGFDPVSVTITADSRSEYSPDGDDTAVTLVADAENGLVLVGAIAGRDRAAIRIDTLATALENRMTVGDLERLDPAYAPAI
jgi:NADPH-dependent 2,4-dienoyl-CoA reductase/sulfur reductase-like enzyme